MPDYHAFLSARRALQSEVQRQLGSAQTSLVTAELESSYYEAARDAVVAASIATQAGVRGFIEDIVKLALVSVYGDEYSFELEYTAKRNNSQAQPWIVKEGNKLDPKWMVGGGVVDVAAFGLRFALWALEVPRSEPVFIFDEPFKWVSKDLTAKVAVMVREVKEVLGVQMLMVSHDILLISAADRAFRVSQEGGVSSVSVLEEG